MNNAIIKRLMAIGISATMALSMCACATAESGESSAATSEVAAVVTETEEKETETEVKEETETETEEASTEEVSTEEVDQYGFTEAQIQELYDSIGLSVKTEYLEPNDIDPEEFEWPDYMRNMELWFYLEVIVQNLLYQGNLNDTTGFNGEIPDNAELMNAVLDGIANWEDTLTLNKGVFLGNAYNEIYPLQTTIPENVDFTRVN